MEEIKISKNDGDQRLDRFLKKYFKNASLSFIYKLIRTKIKISNEKKKENYILKEGDVISISLDEKILSDLITKKKDERQGESSWEKIKIIYEDENILIALKPKNLLVHGDKNEKKKTLTNMVVNYLIEKKEYNVKEEKVFTPSPVHRIDRNTKGLVIFAKNAGSLRSLNFMFREKDYIEKKYKAEVFGKIEKKINIEGYILKDEIKNKSKVYFIEDIKKLKKEEQNSLKKIKTIVSPIFYDGKKTTVDINLITGKSHQIRASLLKIGHPILGDEKYKGKENRNSKKRTSQELTAYKIKFLKGYQNLEYLSGKEFEI